MINLQAGWAISIIWRWLVMPKDRSIYICHTLYHVYIALLKTYESKSAQPADVMLVSTIPSAESLYERLYHEHEFGKIMLLRRDDVFLDTHSYHANRVYAKTHLAVLDKRLKALADYEDVYLFNDYTELGAYLNLRRIKYHLIEDGLDCYKATDQYAAHGKAQPAKRFLRRFFDIPLGLGWGPGVIDLEVNDSHDLKTDLKFPVVEVPRSELYAVPSKEQVAQLFRIFDADELNHLSPGSALILTDPLWELGVVSSSEENVKLFSRMAKALGAVDCYVKPHPRDDSDYSAAFPVDRIVGKTMPIELLNYLSDERLALAATWSSTAIYGLEAACKVAFNPDNHDPRVEHMTLEGYSGRR